MKCVLQINGVVVRIPESSLTVGSSQRGATVFLGYSLAQSAFLFFDPTLKKIFVSRQSSLWRMFSYFLPLPPHPHISGSRHGLYSPRFLVHLERSSRTAKLNRPPECFPITQPDLPPTNIPLTCLAKLNKPP